MQTATTEREVQYRIPLRGRIGLAFGLVIAICMAAGAFAMRGFGDGAASVAGYLVIILPPLIAAPLAALWLWRSITGALRRMCELVQKAADGQPDVVNQLRDSDEFSVLMRRVLEMGEAIGQRAADAADRRRIQEIDQVRRAEEQARRLTQAEFARQLQDRDRLLKEMERTRQEDAQAQLLHTERQREQARQHEELLQAREQDRLAREDRRRQLAEHFETQVAVILGHVQDAIQELRGTAAQMANMAVDSARRSNEASGIARQGDETAAQVSSSANSLSEAALRMRGQAEASRANAQTAVTETSDAATAISELFEATRQIGSIAGIINEITRQTSLLSINARIEAARAGEAGRGFAVVASEVMELAARTRKATDSIDEQISQVTHAAQRSADMLGRLGKRISELGEAAGSMFETAEVQCRSTLDISERMRAISRSTQSIASSINAARGTASETERRSSAVLDAAEGVEEQTRRMQEQVARFVRGIRTGLPQDAGVDADAQAIEDGLENVGSSPEIEPPSQGEVDAPEALQNPHLLRIAAA